MIEIIINELDENLGGIIKSKCLASTADWLLLELERAGMRPPEIEIDENSEIQIILSNKVNEWEDEEK